MNSFDDEPRIAGATPIIVDKPKVKLIRNAKGDPQWEISAVEGYTEAHLDVLRVQALRQWRELEHDLLGVPRP